MPLSFVEERVAASTWLCLRLDNIEHAGSRFPCLLLFVRWLAADGDRTGVVRVVAAKTNTKVQNHELAGLDLAVAGGAASRIRSKVLTEISWRLTERVYRHRIELGVDIELIGARSHDLAGALVHGPIGFVCASEHSQF